MTAELLSRTFETLLKLLTGKCDTYSSRYLERLHFSIDIAIVRELLEENRTLRGEELQIKCPRVGLLEDVVNFSCVRVFHFAHASATEMHRNLTAEEIYGHNFTSSVFSM